MTNEKTKTQTINPSSGISISISYLKELSNIWQSSEPKKILQNFI